MSTSRPRGEEMTSWPKWLDSLGSGQLGRNMVQVWLSVRPLLLLVPLGLIAVTCAILRLEPCSSQPAPRLAQRSEPRLLM